MLPGLPNFSLVQCFYISYCTTKPNVSGTAQMDGAILVVAATDGTMPQTREHLLLAKQIGLKRVVVFINKADATDDEMVEIVELEVRDLLEEYGFDSKETPVVAGSALKALQGDEGKYGTPSIVKLVQEIDKYIKVPERKLDASFFLPVESAVGVQGRGTVLIGTLKQGTIKKGDVCELLGWGNRISTNVLDIQVFNKSVPEVKAGENVGVLVKSVRQDIVKRGMYLCQSEKYSQTNYLEAQIYVLTAAEGGRSKPIMVNYSQLFMYNIWNLEGRILEMPENTDMIMPGETVKVKILLRKSMVVEEGVTFTIRENNQTTISGIVTQVLPMNNIEIPGFNYRLPPKMAVVGAVTAAQKRKQKAKKDS